MCDLCDCDWMCFVCGAVILSTFLTSGPPTGQLGGGGLHQLTRTELDPGRVQPQHQLWSYGHCLDSPLFSIREINKNDGVNVDFFRTKPREGALMNVKGALAPYCLMENVI